MGAYIANLTEIHFPASSIAGFAAIKPQLATGHQSINPLSEQFICRVFFMRKYRLIYQP